MSDVAGGEIVFVGSYASADVPGIHVVSVDGSCSEIRLDSSFSGVDNPSFLTVHPSGGYLFAVSETGIESDGTGGAVHSFQIDRDAGELDLVALNQRSTGGDHPCHLSIDRDGRWLAVSNYGSGSAAVFAIEPDGNLGEMASSVRHRGAGPVTARQQGPHAHSAIFTPDDQFMVVADLGIDRLVVYGFDATSGALIRHDEIATAPGAGPRHIHFHPAGDHLFAVNELDNTITVYDYETGSGRLRAVQTLSTLRPGTQGSIAAAIRIDRSGSRVYVSNRGDDSVAVYEFDRGSGLTLLDISPCGGAWPRDFGLIGDGSHMLVANQHSGTVVLLPVSAGGRQIGTAGGRCEISQPTCIALVG